MKDAPMKLVHEGAKNEAVSSPNSVTQPRVEQAQKAAGYTCPACSQHHTEVGEWFVSVSPGAVLVSDVAVCTTCSDQAARFPAYRERVQEAVDHRHVTTFLEKLAKDAGLPVGALVEAMRHFGKGAAHG